MKKYELLATLKPNLDNDEADKIVAKVEEIVTGFGGKVDEIEKMGRKKLSFDVKGFRDGIAKGKKDSQKEIAHLFDKYLDFSIKGKPNKIKQRAFDKFTQYLEVSNGDD